MTYDQLINTVTGITLILLAVLVYVQSLRLRSQRIDLGVAQWKVRFHEAITKAKDDTIKCYCRGDVQGALLSVERTKKLIAEFPIDFRPTPRKKS